MASRFPAIFISHGGPNIVIDPIPAREHLKQLPGIVGSPRAIVVVSAHFETHGATVSADPQPATVHDFGGFDEALYRMRYPAPGDPELAQRIFSLIQDAQLDARIIPEHGFDHGVWTPLILAWPDANIPVVPVSVDPSRDAAWHIRLGKALAPLREEGVLVIGSGHITHNLGAFFSVMRGGAIPAGMEGKVEAFIDWMGEALESGDEARLSAWRDEAPFARENHPTDEHLMPLFAAWGAGMKEESGQPSARRLHRSMQNGFFAYESWLFD